MGTQERPAFGRAGASRAYAGDAPDPYTSDPAKFGRAGGMLAEVDAELARAE